LRQYPRGSRPRFDSFMRRLANTLREFTTTIAKQPANRSNTWRKEPWHDKAKIHV